MTPLATSHMDAKIVAQVPIGTPIARPASLASKSLSGWRAFAIIFSCALIMCISILGSEGLIMVLPNIGADMNIPEASLQWVISSYTLTSGCFLLLFGRLADVYGRRRTFLAGTAWAAVWSVGCGFAKEEINLDVMRALQGIGIAAGVPAALGVLAQTFEAGSRLRTLAFATLSCGSSLGCGLGFVVASILTEKTRATWRSFFFLTAGFSGLAFIAGWLSIDKDTHHLDPALDTRIDWIGALLVTSALVLLTFALGDGETAPDGWRTNYILASLILSIVLLEAFLLWEYHLGQQMATNPPSNRISPHSESWTFMNNILTAPPLLNLSLLTRAKGRMAAMQALVFFVWAGFSGWIFYAVLYYQTYMGLSPIHTMVRMIPMMASGIILNVVVALVVSRVQGIVLLIIGCVMTGLSSLLFALIDTSAPYWAFGFPAAISSVFGADFIFSSGSLFVAKVANPDEQSVAGGLFNTLASIGASVGLTASSVVLNRTIARKIRSLGLPQPSSSLSPANTPKSALLAGYRAVQWLNFAFVMVGLVLALIFLKGIGIVTKINAASSKEEVELGPTELEADDEVVKGVEHSVIIPNIIEFPKNSDNH